MKVLQISNYYFVRGGSDTYFLKLCSALRALGISVIPFCGAHVNNLPSEWTRYFPSAVDVDEAGARDIWKYCYSRDARNKLIKLLEAEQPDVAHLHIYYGRLTCSILPILRQFKVPVVQTLHDYKLVCPVYSCLRREQNCEKCHGRHFWRSVVYRCNRHSLRRSLASAVESYAGKLLGSHSTVNHYISVSDFQRERLLANRVVSGDQITTVHNFVDSSSVEPSSSAGSYFCYFGRIEKSKGLVTLVQSMREIPEAKLKLVGSGSWEAECRRMLVQNHVGNVELCGYQTGRKLSEIIRGAICTVVPSEAYENCPMSILESFAHGIPVIGTTIGGIPELISDGKDGILIPPASPEALSAALRFFMENPSSVLKMGQAARRKVDGRFGVSEHLRRIEQIYEKVMSMSQ